MTAVVFMILELQPRYYNVSDMSMRSPADCGVIAANCYNYNYKQPSISVSISGPEQSTNGQAFLLDNKTGRYNEAT